MLCVSWIVTYCCRVSASFILIMTCLVMSSTKTALSTITIKSTSILQNRLLSLKFNMVLIWWPYLMDVMDDVCISMWMLVMRTAPWSRGEINKLTWKAWMVHPMSASASQTLTQQWVKDLNWELSIIIMKSRYNRLYVISRAMDNLLNTTHYLV